MTRLDPTMFLLATALATVAAANPAGVEFPGNLRSAVGELRSALRIMPVYSQHSAEVVNSISKWVSDAVKDHSIDEVIEALRTAIPVEMDDGKRWRHDRDLPAAPGIPIVASVATWRSENREVVVLRFDRVLRPEESAYLRSTLPMLIAKVGDEVVVGSTKQWSYLGECETMCGFHGFLPGPAGALPDVLLSRGPKGTGSFVTLGQVHFSEQAWNVVWEDSIGDCCGTISFEPQRAVLSYDYGYERVKGGPPLMREEQVRLKYGGK